MVWEGRMFELCTRPGKSKSPKLECRDTDEIMIRVHVCVGDMNAEQGEKLASELPG